MFRLFLVLLTFSLPFAANANGNMTINEICWMGTDISANDEWLELYNDSDQTIDLAGWTLKAGDGSPEISLMGTIATKAYFLLERSDDQTVPAVSADQFYTGALANTGEHLQLYDASGGLVDETDQTNGWLGGNNETKQTLEKTSGGWSTSVNPNGTPKTLNSTHAPETEQPPPSHRNEQTDTQAIATSTRADNLGPRAEAGPDVTGLIGQKIPFNSSSSSDPDHDDLSFFWNFGDGASDNHATTSHSYLVPGQYIVSLTASDNQFIHTDTLIVNIFARSVMINEFMPEWIELYNQGDEIANLSDWQIDNGQSDESFIFADNTLLAAGGFLVLPKNLTRIALAAGSGQIRLLYPNGSPASIINYNTGQGQGQSIAFNGQTYAWTKVPTPGFANMISATILDKKRQTADNPAPSIQQVKSSSVADATTVPTGSQIFAAADSNAMPPPLAALSQTVPKQKNFPLTALLVIIPLTFFAGYLLIKIKKR